MPIHVFPLGDERISGDLAIQTIDAPRVCGAGTRVPVRVTLRAEATTASARAADPAAGCAWAEPLASSP